MTRRVASSALAVHAWWRRALTHLGGHGDHALLDPVTGRPLRALSVVDVELDPDVVVPVPPVTPFASPPEGVHAVVWLDGEPVGHVTVAGDPREITPILPAIARARLATVLQARVARDQPGSAPAADGEDSPDPAARAIPPESPPTVTVAVCTRDRPEALRRCLRALTCLDVPVLEIFAVDNAPPDDRTRAVVSEFPGVRYVREPRAGLDFARNRALVEARGDVIAYTDDDVLVHPGWIRGLLKAFAEEPRAASVTGLVVPAELSTPPQVLFELCGGFGRGYSRKWFSVDVQSGDVAARTFGGTGRAGTGANMAVRRAALLELGGFDVALDVGTPTGGGGDLEMFYRIVAAGHLLVYEPSAVVRHCHRSSFEELRRQMHAYGTGSYSMWLGAGAEYDAVQRRAFRWVATKYALRHHLARGVRSLLLPQPVPRTLILDEAHGMIRAVATRLYRRACQHASEQNAKHPGPSPAPLVRPATRRRTDGAPAAP